MNSRSLNKSNNWPSGVHNTNRAGYYRLLKGSAVALPFSNHYGSGLYFSEFRSFIVTKVKDLPDMAKLIGGDVKNLPEAKRVLPLADCFAANVILLTSNITSFPIQLVVMKNRYIPDQSPLIQYLSEQFDSLHDGSNASNSIIEIDDIADCLKFKFMFGAH